MVDARPEQGSDECSGLLIAERYRLLNPVGSGGMGRVWLARDEMLHRDVAIKEVQPPEWMTDGGARRARPAHAA